MNPRAREPSLARRALFERGAVALSLGLLALGAQPACSRENPHGPARPTAISPRPPTDAPAVAPAPSPDAGAASAPTDPALAATLARIDAEVRSLERIAAARSDDWLNLEQVASLYLRRAALSADYDDYGRAQDAIDRAFRAGAGVGPYLVRAQLNYTLHRLDRVTPDLDAIERGVIVPPPVRAAVAALRANVAFHSGRYAEARAAYERIAREDPSAENLAALAQYRWKTGDFDGADALLARAQREAATRAPEVRGWLCLVRGLLELDRGRWPDALSHYRDGLTHRPGYWLLEEHEAEILSLQGELDRARARYLDLIERTHNPEFMDALADLESRRGDRASADRWIARARAVYDARLARFPEAVAGHAVEHFLAHDPARAVAVAEANVRARPGGEAQVHLARAYLAVGRAREAQSVLDRVLATPWRTAELFAAAHETARALGRADDAQRHRRAALALDPHALDDSPADLPRDR
jgi:tetratricopeptide (TPR) repeat protein